MKITNTIKVIALSLFAYLPATAFANVAVYKHCDFKGYKVTLAPGSYDLKDLKRRGVINDDISSLKVPRGFEVIVYEHHHFQGRKLKFRSNDSCLVNNGFNDRISSIKVKRVQVSRPTKPKKATVYKHCGYKGYSVGLAVGNYDLNRLKQMGIKNDDLSSLKVSPGYEIIVYQHHHFQGRKLKFRTNDTCLVNNNFNDIISSIKVRRAQVTRPKPKKAVVYKHCGFKGYRVGLAVGNYDLKQLNRLGIKNDDLSSLKVSRGYEIIVYQHHHFQGRKLKFRGSDSCLVNNNFNDIISSIKVRRARR